MACRQIKGVRGSPGSRTLTIINKYPTFPFSCPPAGQGALASILRASGDLGGAAGGCPSAGKRCLAAYPGPLPGRLQCWDCLELHQICEFRLNLVNSSFTLCLLYPLSPKQRLEEASGDPAAKLGVLGPASLVARPAGLITSLFLINPCWCAGGSSAARCHAGGPSRRAG